MSSLLAEHLAKYGYKVYRPDGRGLMDVDHHPQEQRLFDYEQPGAWPIVVDIQTVADYIELQYHEFFSPRTDGAEPIIGLAHKAPASSVMSLHDELRGDDLQLVPPYPLMLVEYTPATTGNDCRVGVVLQTHRLAKSGTWDDGGAGLATYFQAVQDGAGDAEWFVEARTITRTVDGEVYLLPTGSTIYLDEDGKLITGHTDILVENSQSVKETWHLNAEWSTFIAMNACKFCHVRKASVREADDADTRRRQKKAQKRGRPFIRHHKLIIEPLEKHMEYVRSLGALTPGSKKALHAVRGHFATYTPERPLGRGKFVGTVWRAPHMRGSKSSGLVTKDYETGKVDDHD